MDRRPLTISIAFATLLAACSAPAPVSPPQTPDPVASVAAAPSRGEPTGAPLTLHGYKRAFAGRVASENPLIFDDPLPEVFKSIVVLDVTIGRDGGLTRVAVRRSNGYKELENAALDSVRQAAPFAVPARPIRRSDGSVNFLETFMFRSDGRFRILSLLNAS